MGSDTPHLTDEHLAEPDRWEAQQRAHVIGCVRCRATARALTGWTPHPTAPLTLGPFILESPIGAGGMGEVWRATSTHSGLVAAIKVIRADVASASMRRLFEREIETVAALDHRHIVIVLDVGQVPPGPAGDRLGVGSTWFAMEFLSGGSLESHRVADWRALERVLLTTLESLAYAHARGVVHRDLKPANLCIGGVDDPRPGLKLCDFGIATAAGEKTRTAGTVPYMAPEQLDGSGAPGPWSDLYSLGVMGWVLASQFVPFDSQLSVDALIEAKRRALPGPTPCIDLPAGYADWLRWLSDPSPQHRPQSAFEALRALRQLGPPVSRPQRQGVDPLSEVPLLTWDTIAMSRAQTASVATPEPAPHTDAGVTLPADWRRSLWRDPPIRLHGAGLGLIQLRHPEIVGQEDARDALWSAALQPGPPIAVVGPPGAGASVLGQWLVRSMRELGGAGLRVDTPQTREALLQVANQLVATLCDAPPPDQSWTNALLSTTLVEWLGILAARRPTVLQLDALGDGPRALAALCATHDLPIQVVWTVRDPPAGCRLVELGVMPTAQIAEILTRTAGLQTASAVKLARRSQGVPGTAVAELRAAVSAGTVHWEASGLVIDAVPHTEGPELALSLDPAQLADLEAAAVVGVTVLAALWEPLCTSGAQWDAVRTLIRQGLAAWSETGWVFTSAAARELLLKRAASRRQALHLAILETLDGSYEGPEPDLWRARHLSALERMDEAFPLWREALWVRRQNAGCHAMSALVQELQGAMDACQLPAEDPRRGVIRASLAQNWRVGGERQACLDEVEALLQDRYAARWPVALSRAQLERSRLFLNDDPDRAWDDLIAAGERLEQAPEDGPEVTVAHIDLADARLWVRYDQARLLGRRQLYDEHIAALESLCEDAATSGCFEIEADACCDLAMALLPVSPESASAWVQRSLALNQRNDRISGTADALWVSGQVSLALGGFEEAHQSFAASLKIHEGMNSQFGVFSRIGLAQTLIRMEALDAASEEARSAVIAARPMGAHVHGLALTVAALVATHLRDLDDAQVGFDTAVEVLDGEWEALRPIRADLKALRSEDTLHRLHGAIDALLGRV